MRFLMEFQAWKNLKGSFSLAVDLPSWNSPLSNACHIDFKRVVVFMPGPKK